MGDKWRLIKDVLPKTFNGRARLYYNYILFFVYLKDVCKNIQYLN